MKGLKFSENTKYTPNLYDSIFAEDDFKQAIHSFRLQVQQVQQADAGLQQATFYALLSMMAVAPGKER